MSYVTGISGNVISAASAGYAPTNSAEVSAIASAYATGAAQVVTAVGTETAITPDGAGDVVTSINGNYISALSADSAFQASYDERGRELSSLPSEYDISSIASAYAASSQVVTSLQYATSESATVDDTVTAETYVGYGSRDISAEYLDYGTWAAYDSSNPLVKVRMTAAGTMRNYSSYPYYLYMVPYGATNQGNASNTSELTGARNYGEFSGDMDDFIIAQGTGSAYSQDPYCVDVTFNVTSVPFWGSQPAWWGTVPEERRYVVDNDEYTRPVFCVAGGYDGYELFELRSNTTAEMDFGSVVTVSAVSGINELGIAGAGGGGGVDSATVSAIASSYAADVSAAASGAVSAVSSNSADWMKLSSCFAGFSGIVTAVGSSTLFTSSASSFMGIDSAFKSTTGVISGDTPYNPYTAQLPDGISNEVIVSAASIDGGDFVDIYYSRYDGSTINDYLHVPSRNKIVLASASGVISAMSRNRPFQVDFTARQPEAIAFQSDLTGAGGIDSATCSAIASAYAESAVSSVSGNYYTTANESGFLTAQEQASWSETASASPSYIVDKPDLVDIVAGPGIVVDNPDGNSLRVSLREDYEEVLYAASTDAGTTLSVNGYITLSESLTHFEKVKIYYALQPSWGGSVSHEIYKVSGDQRIVLEQLWFREQSGYNNYWQTITFSKYSDTNLTITLVDGSQRPILKNTWGSTGLTLTVFKIVGIHRIANN